MTKLVISILQKISHINVYSYLQDLDSPFQREVDIAVKRNNRLEYLQSLSLIQLKNHFRHLLKNIYLIYLNAFCTVLNCHLLETVKVHIKSLKHQTFSHFSKDFHQSTMNGFKRRPFLIIVFPAFHHEIIDCTRCTVKKKLISKWSF